MCRFVSSLFALLFVVAQPLYAASQPQCWSLSRADQQLWLLGSVHLGQQDFYPLPDAIDRAFNKAQALWLEVNMATATSDELSRGMALTQSSQPLPALLSTQSVARFEKLAEQYGLPMAMFAPYKPWFAALLLSQSRMTQLGYQSDLGIDNFFSQQAIEQGKPVNAFEGFGEQMAILASIEPYQQQMVDYTLSQLEDAAQFERDLKMMMASWMSGDEAALRQIMTEQSGPKALQQWLEEQLLVRRNRAWIEILEEKKPQSAFIVVGALHISGDQGLVALLKQRGFTAKATCGE